jgi:hypothetical protein
MRLYLFDLPEGLSARILAIAIVAPEPRFEPVVEAAAPHRELHRVPRPVTAQGGELVISGGSEFETRETPCGGMRREDR